MKEYDYSQPGAYFITICVHKGMCLFGQIHDGEVRLNDMGQVVRLEWLRTEIVRPNVLLDEFVIMPNHLHGIIFFEEDAADARATHRVAPTKPCGPMAGTLGAIIAQLKSASAKQINDSRNTRGKQIWQRNYYEHVIRNEDELQRVRQYIIDNPIKWELDRENPAVRKVEGIEPWEA